MTSVWSEHFTKEGRAYYYNRKTKQSAWVKPADFDGVAATATATSSATTSASGSAGTSTSTSGKQQGSGQATAKKGGVEWEELWDPKNARHYYYNRATRKTQWQKPENVEIRPHVSSSTATTAGATAATANTATTTTTKASSAGHAEASAKKEKRAEKSTASPRTRANSTSDYATASTTEATADATHSKTNEEDSGRSVSSRKSSTGDAAGAGTPRSNAKHHHHHHRHDNATEKAETITALSPRKPKKDVVRTPTKKATKTGADLQVTSHKSPQQLVLHVLEEEDDGTGEEANSTPVGDSAAQLRKRKKKSKSERLEQSSSSSSSRKKLRSDNEAARMIICDDDHEMNQDRTRVIDEKDTEDGKEATRLLLELSQTDAIMEVNVLGLINGFLRAHNESNGPEILVERLSSSYRGHAQMVGLVGSWLDALPVSKAALEHKLAFDVAEGPGANDQEASWDPASDILYSHLKEVIAEHYEPKLVSNVLSGSSTEPEWLTAMLGDQKWRMMLIELAEKHKTCNLLQYAIQRISEAGHHKEIASITNANAIFSVFNGILLDAFCRIPFASDDEARADLDALKKICCQSAYSYVYAEELLCSIDHKLYLLQQNAHDNPQRRAHYRTTRSKLNRVRSELQETTIAKVGEKIEAYHPLRRRYLYDSNVPLSSAILSIVKTKKCSELAADALVKEYRSTKHVPPAAHLRDPLVFRSLLDPLFNPSEPVSQSFAQNCTSLLAYAACAKDERSILLPPSSMTEDCTVSVDDEELAKTKSALDEASTICRSDHTLSYTMNQTGVVEKLSSVMDVPVASMGVLHWIEVTLRSPAFFNSSLLNVCFASLLRLVKASTNLHVSQWPIAFRVLVVSLRLHPEINPVKALELKRETLRSMVFMISSGYVLPILDFIFTNISELDQALLRNFITMLFARIAPPYSAKFVVALTRILTHPKVQNAVKSCPPDCKAKLSSFVSYCKKNTGVLSSDQLQALVIAQEGI